MHRFKTPSTLLFNNLLHYIRMSGRALRGKPKQPISATRLMLTYWGLILKSFIQHRLRRGPSPAKRLTNIHGCTISYSTLPVLISLYEEIFIERLYAFETTTSSPVILDCGSNIGMSVLYFKLCYPESMITAFEPDATSFFTLERNMRENHLENVTLINQALGREKGERLLYTPSERNTSLNPTLLLPENSVAVTSVKVNCLSSFITGQVDFVKMDIEGSETEVLEDLIRSRKIELVKRMVIEFHHDQSQVSLKNFTETIEAARLKVSVIKTSTTESLLMCVRNLF